MMPFEKSEVVSFRCFLWTIKTLFTLQAKDKFIIDFLSICIIVFSTTIGHRHGPVRMSLTQYTETNEPLPVVIIGKRVEIGGAVAKSLLPDIEGTCLSLVLQFFMAFQLVPHTQEPNSNPLHPIPRSSLR